MLEHLAARLGAIPARLGAGGHVLVVWGLLTRRGALVATLRATLQHVAGERAFPGAQGRTRLAALAAVGAELCRLGVFLLAVGDERQAVLEAGIALELTVGADFGARHEVLVVFVRGACRQPNRGDDGDGECDRRQATGYATSLILQKMARVTIPDRLRLLAAFVLQTAAQRHKLVIVRCSGSAEVTQGLLAGSRGSNVSLFAK